jgi:hypothetical protein
MGTMESIFSGYKFVRLGDMQAVHGARGRR